MFKRLFIIAIVLCVTTSTVFAGTYRANARTKRIPAGTTLEIEFLQPVSTFSGCAGDSFTAMLKSELATDRSIVLPQGSIVRGSIGKVNTAKRLSRGAKLYIDFDHVVTPNGRQIPLEMALCQFDKIDFDGALYINKGYGEAIQNNYKKAVEITKNSTNYGLKAGESAPGIQYLTTPICAVGGFIGSVGYYLGDSIIDLFRKGQDVHINKGQKVVVKLLNPIDIPIY